MCKTTASNKLLMRRFSAGSVGEFLKFQQISHLVNFF